MLSNCYTYNKIGQPVHILGQRIEKLFNAELRKAGHGHLIRNIKKQPRCASGVLLGGGRRSAARHSAVQQGACDCNIGRQQAERGRLLRPRPTPGPASTLPHPLPAPCSPLASCAGRQPPAAGTDWMTKMKTTMTTSPPSVRAASGRARRPRPRAGRRALARRGQPARCAGLRLRVGGAVAGVMWRSGCSERWGRQAAGRTSSGQPGTVLRFCFRPQGCMHTHAHILTSRPV